MAFRHQQAVTSAGRTRVRTRDLVRLVRPHQWSKSLLVVPLALLHPGAWTWPGLAALATAVVLFVLASAAVYVNNDIADADHDRRHPSKCDRPIAAGRVPVGPAAALAVTLLTVMVLVAVFTVPLLIAPLGGYVLLNVAYSRWLKHLPLFDLFVVAAGFALRVLTGYLAVGLRPSGWLLLCVFLLCFLPILGKRRRELDLPDQSRRPVLHGYSTAFLDHLLVLNAGLAAVTFVLYIRDWLGPPADLVLVPLLPLVLFGLCQYLHIVLVQRGGADPARGLLRDRALVVNGVLFLLVLGGAALATAPL